jgi:GNAT superfamily N-acetyltransferase
MNLKIKRLKGEAILPYIEDFAWLRMEVFKAYPYLYEGDLTCEREYLQNYIACPETILVLAFDEKKVIGVSSAIPLEFETVETKKPFLEHNMNIQDIFYLDSSVLLPAYRGKNIYRHFFHEREAAAIEYGCKITTFCAIERPFNHPKKPDDYFPLNDIWTHFGYKKCPELSAYFEWKEVGEESKSRKPLVFWMKYL